jgi:hypothetical protein
VEFKRGDVRKDGYIFSLNNRSHPSRQLDAGNPADSVSLRRHERSGNQLQAPDIEIPLLADALVLRRSK